MDYAGREQIVRALGGKRSHHRAVKPELAPGESEPFVTIYVGQPHAKMLNKLARAALLAEELRYPAAAPLEVPLVALRPISFTDYAITFYDAAVQNGPDY